MNKDVATIILNRNLPKVTDKLYNHIKKYDGIVIECGPGKVLSGLAKTNGIENILSMCSDNFYEELQNLL